MKKTILTMTIIVIIAGAITTLFGLVPDNKSIKTGINFQEAHSNRIDAKVMRNHSILVYQKFLRDSEIKINQNKRCFAQFKVILSKINQKDNATCRDKVNGLEQNNNNLKNILAHHKTDKRQYKWTSNSREFNLDLDKLEMKMWSIN